VLDYLRVLYLWFRGDILAIPGRAIACGFLVLLFIIPGITTDSFVLRILILTNTFAIFAASWDLLAGFAGQLNLGHGLFFGVAGYTAALLNTRLGFPPAATIPMGALGGVLAGLIVGIPALRVRGFYLALVTLAFPLILTSLIPLFPEFTGGELGIFGISPLSGSRIFDYYLILIVMLFSLAIMWKLTDARSKVVRTGVIFHAIREDEITARASGIETTRYKLLAFSISGFFAGIAGGLYIHFVRIAGPSILELLFSLQPVLWTIFGGIGTILGPVVGVYILYPLMAFLTLREAGELIRYIVLALILICVLLFMPQGITTWARNKMEETCPRCKLVNAAARSNCRVCGTPLHQES
jgi:branched-chain amino acid transport system permease protein